ncbi:MAG TPA: transposase [Methylophilaceae bacterium]|nr:transposase [Methylophilaceae bacterium]
MPRRPRIVFNNSTVHLTQRGNNRSACFFADEDYAFYLDQLALACKTHVIDLHAYVLLTNQVHLLLSAADGQAPSRMMKQLGQRYVQYINRTYQRSGTLWEGRFRSCIVGEEDYVMGCYRYIELAPVRDGAVNQPADYRRSSYRTNALDESLPLLVAHPFMQALGANEVERKNAYRELFSHPLDNSLVDEIRGATNGNLVLGSEQFQRQIGDALKLRTWRGKAGRPKRKS